MGSNHPGYFALLHSSHCILITRGYFALLHSRHSILITSTWEKSFGQNTFVNTSVSKHLRQLIWSEHICKHICKQLSQLIWSEHIVNISVSTHLGHLIWSEHRT